jgi:hypothetical protein
MGAFRKAIEIDEVEEELEFRGSCGISRISNFSAKALLGSPGTVRG